MGQDEAQNADSGPTTAPPDPPFDTTQFKEVAISDWLAVRASQPLGDENLYVSGDTRIDGELLLQTLAFQANSVPSTAEIAAQGEAVGQLGITGTLRIQDVLGVGTGRKDDLDSIARVVVRGMSSGSLPLQVWQDAETKSLAILDADGR